MAVPSRQGGRLRLLVDVLRSFADATTDYARLLDTIVERVAGLTGHATSVRLLNATGSTLETAALFDPLADETFGRFARAPIPVTSALRGALDGGRAFHDPLVSRANVDEAHPNGGASALRLKSVIVAPLVARGKALGVLFVVRRKEEDDSDFAPEDVELVDALAHHAALALANARLMSELDSVERAREHERSILDTVEAPLILLNRTARIIGANRAFHAAFGLIADTALGEPLLEVAGGALDVPGIRGLFEDLPPRSSAGGDDVQVRLESAHGPRTYLVRSKRTVRPGNASETTLVTLIDLTDRLAASAIARRHTLIISSTSEAIIALDAEFIVEEWNPAAERLFGWSAPEAKGKPVIEVLSIVDGVDRERNREALRSGARIRSQMRAKNRAGEWVDLEYSSMPIIDRGRTTGFVTVLVDITERLRLEREVHRRVEELTVANQELESFSYSVSHDLRTPVRAIDGFSEILEEDHGAGLDEEGRRLLGLVRKNAKRMGRLIDDIVALSRCGRQAIECDDVDMNALAAAALEDALGAEPKRAISAEIAPLPAAWGDPGLLHQVWANLYSNAVKYTRGRPAATIATTAEETATEIVYTVKDNGAGFDMRHADKLFGTFERLHSSREFEGTGIGLALVARIIRRHGGRAWGEGETGRGATFHIALPKRQQKETRG